MNADEFRKWWETATPRERDVKVAELVFSDRGDYVPDFTTVIADAWEVWEVMKADYFRTLNWGVDDKCVARLAARRRSHAPQARCDTAPEAICLAACLAKLAEDN